MRSGPVYALSARPGSGDPAALRRFRADLARFLRTERAATVGGSARRSAQRLLANLRLALDLERHAATLPADELARRRARLEQTVRRLDDDAATDAALLQAAVHRGLAALDETIQEGAGTLERQAAHATERAAQAHADLGPGKLLEVLQAERPALLEGLCRPTVERAGAAAVAVYRRAAEPVTARALSRAEQLQAEAAGAFGVPIATFVPPDLDMDIPRVRFTYPRVTLLAEDIAPAAWRLLGARAARARATAKARGQAVDETRMVFGRLRGETSHQLGEAARQLGARLRRHQAELAASLVAAVERGQDLVAKAEQDRAWRITQLDHTAALLEQAEAALGAG
jgi:hypothetical protein